MFHINFLRSPYTVKNIPCGKPSPLLHHHCLPPSLALQVSNTSLTRCNSLAPVPITHLLPWFIPHAPVVSLWPQWISHGMQSQLKPFSLGHHTIIPNSPEPLSAPSAAPNLHRHQLMPEQALTIAGANTTLGLLNLSWWACHLPWIWCDYTGVGGQLLLSLGFKGVHSRRASWFLSNDFKAGCKCFKLCMFFS